MLRAFSGKLILYMNAKGPIADTSTFYSGKDLVPSGKKSLPEPMFTQLYVAICRHYATMSQ